MSSQLKGACIFGQSGGPTAVINASMYGVVSAALASENITHVYGAQYGIKGVLEDKLFDMGAENAEELRASFGLGEKFTMLTDNLRAVLANDEDTVVIEVKQRGDETAKRIVEAWVKEYADIR